jgi:hypothetical protein
LQSSMICLMSLECVRERRKKEEEHRDIYMQREKTKRVGEECECREDMSGSFHIQLDARSAFALFYDLFDEFGMCERKAEEGGRA